jgi:hypothetical protein
MLPQRRLGGIRVGMDGWLDEEPNRINHGGYGEAFEQDDG